MAMVPLSPVPLNIERRQLVAPLPKQAIVKPPGEPWRELMPGEEHDARYYVDLSTFATMCPMAPNESAAKHIEHGLHFMLPMFRLCVSPPLKEQCFPDPNEPMALARVRCRRNEEQWLVLLADLWQHANKIKDLGTVVREVKQADKMLKGEELRSTSSRFVRLDQFLQSLDPAEIQHAASVNIITEKVSLHT